MRGDTVGFGARPETHDEVAADGPLQGFRGVQREQPAVIHDRQALAQMIGLLHVMRGEHDRLPLGVDLADDLPQRDP